LLMLLAVFAVGFASDFLIVKYYQAIAANLGHRAAVFNSIIFLINVLFIGMVQEKNAAMLVIFLLGQDAGIEAAVWLEGEKIGRNAE
jgi:hypothetical protein